MSDIVDPNLGISIEDRKKADSYFRSATKPPRGNVVINRDTDDSYFDTHSPDIEKTGKFFGEITAIDLSHVVSLFTTHGFSFQVIKEDNGNPKIIIKVNEDINDLTVEVKTGGRIIGVNTVINTSE
jgi:hypothetical protein